MEVETICRPAISNFKMQLNGKVSYGKEFFVHKTFETLTGHEATDVISVGISTVDHATSSIIQPILLETLENNIMEEVGHKEVVKYDSCKTNPEVLNESLVAWKDSSKFHKKCKNGSEADRPTYKNICDKVIYKQSDEEATNSTNLKALKEMNYLESFDESTTKKNGMEANMYDVKYIKLNKGTRTGRPKLFDSLGFSYSQSTNVSKHWISIKWRCIKRTKKFTCPASVIEADNCFKRFNKHCHPGNSEDFETSVKLKVQEKNLNGENKINLKNKKERLNLQSKSNCQKEILIREKTIVSDCKSNFIADDYLDLDQDVNLIDLKIHGNDSTNKELIKMTRSNEMLDEGKKQSSLMEEYLNVAPFHKLHKEKSFCSNIKKIKYIMLQNSRPTLAGNPKLIDNLGFTYSRRSQNVNSKIIKWHCVKCTKPLNCPSSVIEIKRIYKRINDHCHDSNPDAYAAAMKFKKEKSSFAQKSEVSNVIRPKLKATKPNLKKKIVTKSKQPVIILKGKNDENEPLLVDKLTGYGYVLKKKIQHRPNNIFKCLQSTSETNCKAFIKKVGKSYILSYCKHNHLSNHDDLKQLNKKFISKSENMAMESNHNSKRSRILKENTQKVNHNNGKLHQIANLNHSSKSRISHVKNNIKTDLFETLDVNKFDNIVLPKELEVELCSIFKTVSNIGLSHDANMLLYLEASKYYLDKMQLNCFHPNNLPSKEWVGKFIRRHPVLSSLMLERLKIYDVENSQNFQLLYSYFQKSFKESFNMDAVEYLNGQYSDRIFCFDVIELIINTAKLVVTLEMKNLKTLENGQRTMSVLCCINSLGNSVKPLIINKGELLVNYESNAEDDDKYSRANSFSGFLTKEVFQEWLILFDKEVELMNIMKPVVLFLNGNFPFISFASIMFARSQNIFIFFLPSHMSRVIHPFRRYIFNELKTNYLRRFESSLNQNCTEIFREQFPSIFLKAYTDTNLPKLAKDAFFECALCPYNFEVSKKFTLKSKLIKSKEPTKNDNNLIGEINPTQSERRELAHTECQSNPKKKTIQESFEVSIGKVVSKRRRRLKITQQQNKRNKPGKNPNKSNRKRKYQGLLDVAGGDHEVSGTFDSVSNCMENSKIKNDEDSVTVDKKIKTRSITLSYDKNIRELNSLKRPVLVRSNDSSLTESPYGNSSAECLVTRVLNAVNKKGNSEVASLKANVPLLNTCPRKSFRISKTVMENSMQILPKLKSQSRNFKNSKHVQNNSISLRHINSKSAEITNGSNCNSKIEDLQNSNFYSTLNQISLENLAITEKSVINKQSSLPITCLDDVMLPTFNVSSAREYGFVIGGDMTDLSMKSSIVREDVGTPANEMQQKTECNSVEESLSLSNSNMDAAPVIKEDLPLLNLDATHIVSTSFSNSVEESISLSNMDATPVVFASNYANENFSLSNIDATPIVLPSNSAKESLSMSNMDAPSIVSASISNSVKESFFLSEMIAAPVVSESFRLKEGYNLALRNIEEVFEKIIDPFVLGVYQHKFEANIMYRDTTFLLWRSLQMLKSSAVDLMKD